MSWKETKCLKYYYVYYIIKMPLHGVPSSSFSLYFFDHRIILVDSWFGCVVSSAGQVWVWEWDQDFPMAAVTPTPFAALAFTYLPTFNYPLYLHTCCPLPTTPLPLPMRAFTHCRHFYHLAVPSSATPPAMHTTCHHPFPTFCHPAS